MGLIRVFWGLAFVLMDVLRHAFLGMYLVVLVLIALYGFHRYMLVFLYYRHRRKIPKLKGRFEDLPPVTVQLPMYNELYVARRIIEASCQIDYPADKLQIQVIDDSTDETVQICREAVARARREGHNIEYLHRTDRNGYKAGALAAAMPRVTGEFIAIFDADFLPEPDILHRTIHYFTDPMVGMVQSRWGHLNRDYSLLTKSQAILLDGHFAIEHVARNRSGRFMSFNGTAGIWRKECIDSAGGWHHDTLAEDLDLSYRAQMKGWKFLFLPELVNPAELPADIQGFKHQQFRWSKGGMQAAKKLLPAVLKSRLPLKIKIEAFFHLTGSGIYLLAALMCLCLFPALYIETNPFERGSGLRVIFDLSLFVLGTTAANTFWMCGQRETYRNWHEKLKYMPILMALGIGISLNNARAVLEALFGKPSEFVRTPKLAIESQDDKRRRQRAQRYRTRRLDIWPFLEFFFGCYMAAAVICSLVVNSDRGIITIGAPFLALFMCGFFYVSLQSFATRRRRRAKAVEGEQPAEEATPAAESASGPNS
jgi:cellulose synthase/poly-beta-1,6-N-acetylglucosamine synthase-like glycosyltransferase